MKAKKINFTNQDGNQLAARLELPVSGKINACAIFAHCFTCSKDLHAVRNISRSLSMNGIAVMRFDFTGLGQSGGDFSESTFSHNVEDLIAAAKHMEAELGAPAILIGHSLGGTATLFAASKIEGVKAVVTIGAPSSPEHAVQHFEEGRSKALEEGEVEVKIGDRTFKINREFIEDFQSHDLGHAMEDLRDIALLIMHSPQDEVVEIENAAEIYTKAHHPKSFITLDGADHLLSNEKDSLYVGNVIASWVQRYIQNVGEDKPKVKHQVYAWLGRSGYTTEIQTDKHSLVADEPEDVGGANLGPSPYELLSSGLAACTAMTLRMYADHKEMDLQEVVVHVDHRKRHCEDMEDCRDKEKKIDEFSRIIEVRGELSEQELDKLLEIAEKCPVHRILNNEIKVTSEIDRMQDR